MKDDDTDGLLGAMPGDEVDCIVAESGSDIFGDFSVLGAGVQIVLDGRTVTSSLG